jgi:hypothetical protein
MHIMIQICSSKTLFVEYCCTLTCLFKATQQFQVYSLVSSMLTLSLWRVVRLFFSMEWAVEGGVVEVSVATRRGAPFLWPSSDSGHWTVVALVMSGCCHNLWLADLTLCMAVMSNVSLSGSQNRLASRKAKNFQLPHLHHLRVCF